MTSACERMKIARKHRIASSAQCGRARAWQRMLSGRRLDLLDPSPLDIEIEDIAHGLARVARWNGQTRRRACLLGGASIAFSSRPLSASSSPSSTAASGWRPDPRRAGICHRRPDQPVQGGAVARLRAFEAKLLAAIHVRFGLPAELPRRRHQVDQARRQDRGLLRGDRAWPASRARRRGASSASRGA